MTFNPLKSVRVALTAGFILPPALALAVPSGGFRELGLTRRLNDSAGIGWISLLFYFNVVQMPALASRANLVLALPMLLCVASASHGGLPL